MRKGIYERKKGKLQKIQRESIYNEIIASIGYGLFTWDHLPDHVTSDMIEKALNTGYATFFKCDTGINKGRFVCIPCHGVSVKRVDNTYALYECSLPDTTYEFTDTNDNFAVGHNNALCRDEYLNIDRFAYQLSLVDESQNALIKWSKMHPIPKVFNDAQATKMTEIINKVMDGIQDVVMSDNSALITGNSVSHNNDVFNLTDVSCIEKMHFLSEYHTELIMRLCNMYNIPFRSNSKSSQSLHDELHDSDFFSQFYNRDRLNYRKKFANEINKKFGLSVTVDYSEIVKNINKSIMIENVSRETNENKTVENTVETVERGEK